MKILNEKKCGNCKITKSINDFYFNKNENCFLSRCKKCVIESSNKWRKKNQHTFKFKSRTKKRRENFSLLEKNKWKSYNKQWELSNHERCLWHSCKKRAKNNNINFNIDVSDIVIPEFCPVFGIKLKRNIGSPKDDSPSVDKIIPELGYVKGNIRVISYKANRLKGNGTIEDFKKIIKYIVSNLS